MADIGGNDTNASAPVEPDSSETAPLLQAQEHENVHAAYFNVDKLIIDNQIYRGSETSNLPLYGRIMSS